MRAIVFAALLALPVQAAPLWSVHPYDGSWDDAVFDLQTTIEGHGLVIDGISHVGDMLARTGADLGATTPIFERADVYQFCSAAISRRAMEADPLNIAYCPYGIFLFQRAGQEGVEIGYRHMPGPGMAEAEDLLRDIVQEVAGVD